MRKDGSGILLVAVFTVGRFSREETVTAEQWRADADPDLSCADMNGDGGVDLSDAVYLLSCLFLGSDCPVCPPRGSAELPATGQPMCYDAAGAVTGCHETEWAGQDGMYRAGCGTDGRFIESVDGKVVTDTCTGLMWERVPTSARYDWQGALDYCEELDFADYGDWRLPNVRELQSLLDYGRSGPAIDPALSAESVFYWSSTSQTSDPENAWSVSFLWGSTVQRGKTNLQAVRAVRTSDS